MLVFGLTGGSGAGKSTAADIFRRLGVYVVDADKIARIIVEKGEPCLEELRAEFGNCIIDCNGSLNRRKLGDIVFGDEKKLKSLNEITHKYIKKEIMIALSNVNCEIAAVDGAVIIGSNVEELCSFIVSVLADRDIRLRRIAVRDGLSCEQAENRLKSQPEDDFYIQNSEYVIYNNGSAAVLERKVKEVYEKIKENIDFG